MNSDKNVTANFTMAKTAELPEEIAGPELNIPDHYSIGIYPNPFNPSTNICYSLPVESHVELSIYDISGRKVTELFNGYCEAGKYTRAWTPLDVDGQRLTSGVYLLQIHAGTFHKTVKMMYAR